MDVLLDDENHLPDDSSGESEGRNWFLLLWTDNEEHIAVIKALDESDIDYVGILHDQEKKPHWHIFLQFPHPKKKHQIAKRLHLDERWIRKQSRKKKSIEYLLHLNDPDKYQYDASGFFGSLTDEASKICAKSANECEADSVKLLLAFIDNYPTHLTYSHLIQKAIELGSYSALRRMGNLGVQLVKEHNELVRLRNN